VVQLKGKQHDAGDDPRYGQAATFLLASSVRRVRTTEAAPLRR
jgi:hypothetical protein